MRILNMDIIRETKSGYIGAIKLGNGLIILGVSYTVRGLKKSIKKSARAFGVKTKKIRFKSTWVTTAFADYAKDLADDLTLAVRN